MYLFLASQDLTTLDLCLFDQAGITHQTHLSSTPESFLFSLDQTLSSWGVVLDAIKGIVVVSGPGSFTSSRLSVIIANAIAFRFGLPLLGVPNPDRLTPEELIKQVDLSELKEVFVQPVYDRPPFIT